MIEDCQDRGIEVVLTYLPFSAAPVQQMTANYIYDIAEEYNVGYINFWIQILSIIKQICTMVNT